LAITKDAGRLAGHRLFLGIVDPSGRSLSYMGWYDPDSPSGPAPENLDGWTPMAILDTPFGDDIFMRGRGDIYFTLAADPTDPNIVYIGADSHIPYVPRYNLPAGTNPCPPRTAPETRGNDFCAFDYVGRLFRGDARIPAASLNPRQFVHITNSNVITWGATPAGFVNPQNPGGTFNDSAPHSGSRFITFDALNHMIQLDDGGIYRRTLPKTNTGDWFSLNGNMQATQFHDISYDSISNVIIGGALNTGTVEQVESGSKIWRTVKVHSGGDTAVDDTSLPDLSIRYESSELLSNPAQIIPRYINGMAFTRTVYDANNNVVIVPGLSGSLPLQFVGGGSSILEQFRTPIELNVVDQRKLVIGGVNFLYESNDRGDTVRQINLGQEIQQMSFGGFKNGVANDAVLWVVAGQNVFFREFGLGTSPLPSQGFANIHTGQTDRITDVVIDPDDYGVVFVIDKDNIYMSENEGGSWIEIAGDPAQAGGLSKIIGEYRQLQYVRRSSGNLDMLLVGGQHGVAKIDIDVARTNLASGSPNPFNAWSRYGAGLPNTLVWDFDYDEADDALVIGMMGRGAWITSGTEVPNQAKLTVEIGPISVSEGGGAGFATARISRTQSDGTPITEGDQVVTITSSDATELLLQGAGGPAASITVTIPNGQSFIDVQLDAVDDLITDSTQAVFVTAVAGVTYKSVSDVIDVTDDDGTKFLFLDIPVSTLPENTGPNAATGTITLSISQPFGQRVFLFSSDPSELTVDPFVDIPANATTATFNINTVDETPDDGVRTVTISAALSGYVSISGNVQTGLVTGVDVVTVTPAPGGTGAGAEDVNRLGDRNLKRSQGAVIIASNIIRNATQAGIRVESGARSSGSDLPNPGSAVNFPSLNNERLVPGAIISNNLIFNFGQAGIVFAGDPNPANDPIAVVPFGKIINNTIVGNQNNNTIVGNQNSQGIGIQVANNASPTLTNNIIAGTETSISIDGTSRTTVVGTTLFKDNTSNPTLGSNPILLSAADALFLDPAKNNYYLQFGSLAIDSSINTLPDRFGFVSVKAPLGMPESNVVAPDRDVFGQLRVDDPLASPPPGLGTNIFKDRGSVERSDIVGPFVSLINPADNDPHNIDIDPRLTIVQLTAGIIERFELLLSDGLGPLSPFEGVGVDATTIAADAVTVTRDGQFLRNGIDYVMGYNATSQILRLTPLSGIWRDRSSYVISLNNKDRFVVAATDGNSISDGTQFEVSDAFGRTVTFEFETGYNLTVPQTFALEVPVEGAGTGGISDGNQFVVSDGSATVVFEFDRNTNVSFGATAIPFQTGQSQDDIATAITNALSAANLGLSPRNLGNGRVHLGSRSNHTVTVPQSSVLKRTGVPTGVSDGDRITISNGATVVRYEFEDLGVGDGVGAGRVAIPFRYSQTNEEIARTFASLIAGNAGLALPDTRYLGSGLVHLGGTTAHTINTVFAPTLTVNGLPGVTPAITIQVPNGAGITDGEAFSIITGGVTETFEMDNNNNVTAGNIRISYTTGSNRDVVSNSIIAVIRASGLGLNPTYLGAGLIQLNETASYVVDSAGAVGLTFAGVEGGAVPVLVNASYSANEVAALIQNAVSNAGFNGVTSSARSGSTIFVDGATSVTGINNFRLGAIRDLAGNALQSNQVDGETRFTILLPGAILDYGDAPISYRTLFVDDGARHAVYVDGAIFLGSALPTTEANGVPGASANGDGGDDGVTFGGPLNIPFNPLTLLTPVTINTSGASFLDAWMDWNGDGDFLDPFEQISRSRAVPAGTFTFQVSTPIDAKAGPTYGRFRLSTTGGLASSGVAVGGEVEDYFINVLPGTPPVAVDDNYSVPEDGTLTTTAVTGVLNGDFDADGDAIAEVILLSSPVNAKTFVFNKTDGSFTYVPNAEYFGPDSFTYRLRDVTGLVSNETATVSITVTEVNDTPVAGNDTAATKEDLTVTITATKLLANDVPGPVQESAQTLTVISVSATSAKGGSVQLKGTNVIYTPAADFTGTDTFTYVIEDDGFTDGVLDPQTATGTVTVTVSEVNDAPVPATDFVSTDEDVVLILDPATLLSNDKPGPATATDETGQTLTITSLSPTTPNGGKVSTTTSGGKITKVIYTPAKDFNGTDTFTYTVADNGTTNGAVNPRSATGTVTVTVVPINDAPTVLDDFSGTAEDTDLLINSADLLTNDSAGPANESSQVLTVSVSATSIQGGKVSISGGQITYSPPADFFGPDTFTYTITDDNTAGNVFNLSATGTVSLTVSEVNDAPTAADDKGVLDEDKSLTLSATGLLQNDSRGPTNENSQTIAIVSVSGSSARGGSVQLTGTGVIYTPAANFNGTDTFTYTISDNGTTNGKADPKTSRATVTLTVNAVNDAPIAGVDNETATEDTSRTISLASLLTNDAPGPIAPVGTADPETSQTITITNVSAASSQGGKVVIVGSNVIYTPAKDFNSVDTGLTDSFTYELTDNGNPALSSVGTVRIIVNEVNDDPVPTGDARSMAEDTLLSLDSVDLTTNDAAGPANESKQTLTVISVSSTSSKGGTVSLSAVGGKISFTPAADFVGTDTFTYVVRDNGTTNASADARTAVGTVTVTVTEVNDAPVAADDLVTAVEDTALTIAAGTLEKNDAPGPVTAVDELTQTLRVTAVPATSTQGGKVLLNTTTNVITYSPVANFNGIDTFVYTVTDNGTTNGKASPNSSTATVTISVSEVNDLPVATLDKLATPEDIAAVINTADLVANDLAGPANENTQTLTVTAVDAVSTSGGTVSLVGSKVTYTPPADFFGTDSFTYTVTDDGTTNGNFDGKATKGTVSVTVTAVNDPPIALNDNRSTTEDIALSFNASTLLTNDTTGPANESSQTLTLSSVSSSSSKGGTVALKSGVITYTPAADFAGTDTFTYVVTDNGTTNGFADPKSSEGTVTVIVTPVNDAPVAVNDSGTSYTMDEDTSKTFKSVLSNDFDVDGDKITAIKVSDPATGALVFRNDGTFDYTPTRDFFGNVTFAYKVFDGVLFSKEATVTITVNNVNELPVALNDSASTIQGTPLIIPVLNNDFDVDGVLDPATVTYNTGSGPASGSVTVNGDGTITYSPTTKFVGTVSFRYLVKDNAGSSSNEATVTVDVAKAPPAWQNSRDRLDVNNSGAVEPIDALLVINKINRDGAGPLPLPGNPPPFYDVDGDGNIFPIDALLVINYLNSLPPSGEGEAAGAFTAFDVLANNIDGMELLADPRAMFIGSERSVQVAETTPALPASLIANSAADRWNLRAAAGPASRLGDIDDLLDDLVHDVVRNRREDSVDSALDRWFE